MGAHRAARGAVLVVDGRLSVTIGDAGGPTLLNQIVVNEGLLVETVTPADDDVHAVYRYLIESEGEES